MKCSSCGARQKKDDSSCSYCGANFGNTSPQPTGNIGGTLGSPTHTSSTTFGSDSTTHMSRTAQIVVGVVCLAIFCAFIGVIIASVSGAFENPGNPGRNADRVEIIGYAQFTYVSPGQVDYLITVKNNTNKTLHPKVAYEIRNNGRFSGSLDINISYLEPNETRLVSGTFTHHSIKSDTQYFFFAIFGTI